MPPRAVPADLWPCCPAVESIVESYQDQLSVTIQTLLPRDAGPFMGCGERAVHHCRGFIIVYLEEEGIGESTQGGDLGNFGRSKCANRGLSQ